MLQITGLQFDADRLAEIAICTFIAEIEAMQTCDVKLQYRCHDRWRTKDSKLAQVSIPGVSNLPWPQGRR